jgi:hypothetical protein
MAFRGPAQFARVNSSTVCRTRTAWGESKQIYHSGWDWVAANIRSLLVPVCHDTSSVLRLYHTFGKS